MKTYLFILSLFTIFYLNFSTAQAWDGKRQGILLGLGAGTGTLDYTEVQSVHLNDSNRTDKISALVFMPKIGYAFSDQFALIYYRNPFNFSATNAQGETESLTACNEVLGFNFYFSSTSPSFYFGYGSGNSYFFPGINNQIDTALKGTGKIYSIGYEFAEHYSIEFTSLISTLNDNQGSFKAYGLVLNILGY